MMLKGSTLTITDHSHTKNPDWSSEVLDVELSSKGWFEGNGPVGIAAEYQDIIDINNDISCNVGSQQRVTGAVALELEKAVAYQERV